jgi:hypothetical protein
MTVDVSEPMEEQASLVADRLHDPWMAMAHGRDSEARGQVYVEIAIDVPNLRALGLLPEERDGAGSGSKGVDARSFDGRDPARELPGPWAGRGRPLRGRG